MVIHSGKMVTWGDNMDKNALLKLEKQEIFINMEKEMFKGNLLDIGNDNYGIVYNLYKQYNEEANLEYIHGRENKEEVEKEFYDNCVLLFSLNNIWTKYNRKSLFKEIHKCLKEDGTIHIWDIDKGYGKLFNAKIKILLPDRKMKTIEIRDYNILKDTSKKNLIKLLQQYFEIIDLRASDNIYYIKGIKKGRKIDESITNSSKL